jgi:hypothetical protein
MRADCLSAREGSDSLQGAEEALATGRWHPNEPGVGICGGSSEEEYLGAIQETGVRFSFAALVTAPSKCWLGAANSMRW